MNDKTKAADVTDAPALVRRTPADKSLLNDWMLFCLSESYRIESDQKIFVECGWRQHPDAYQMDKAGYLRRMFHFFELVQADRAEHAAIIDRRRRIIKDVLAKEAKAGGSK